MFGLAFLSKLISHSRRLKSLSVYSQLVSVCASHRWYMCSCWTQYRLCYMVCVIWYMRL